jgi:hypothetical protein
MVGPKVQDDLFDILVRFRKHRMAFPADIAKMYRQIQLTESDKDYHRFVWRDNPEDEICDYIMSVVTFGVASSPHQAQRVQKQLAHHDENDNFPLATPILEDDLYMDDVLSGADDTSSAIYVIGELDGMVNSGGLELR